MENKDIRKKARELLKGNWTEPVLVNLILFGIFSAINVIPFVSFIVMLLISGPLMYGANIFYLNFVRKKKKNIEDLFKGFNEFTRALSTWFLTTLYAFLWSLLFFIPGIIALYSYSMSYLILKDNPKISATQAIRMSKDMMKGNKWKLFCLNLSFLGWTFLSFFTFGIGLLWVFAYRDSSIVLFYEEISKKNN